MTTDDKIKDEKCSTILTEKLQYRHYHQVNLINMNTLQVNEYYFLIRLKCQNKVSLLFLLEEKLWKNKQSQSMVKEKTIRSFKNYKNSQTEVNN